MPSSRGDPPRLGLFAKMTIATALDSSIEHSVRARRDEVGLERPEQYR